MVIIVEATAFLSSHGKNHWGTGILIAAGGKNNCRSRPAPFPACSNTSPQVKTAVFTR